MIRGLFLLAVTASLVACRTAGPTGLGPHALTPLTDTQAYLVIEQRLLAASAVIAKDQGANLHGVGPTRVDFVFGTPAHGIVWLSAADRAAGGHWPALEEQAPLRVLTGSLDNGAPLQALLLESEQYLYESNPRWVQRGAPGIDSVEDRLARDVGEFLEYVAAEDAPLSAP